MIDAGLVTLVTAGALGLRHALDPDHLVAVTGLAAGEPTVRPRRLALIGASWGAGHAASLALAGLVALWAGWQPGEAGQQNWERIVGLLIAVIGLRLIAMRVVLVRPASLPPTRRGFPAAFLVGVVHGLAGSAGVTLLLLPLAAPGLRVPALLLFAAMTAVSMVGCILAVGGVVRRVHPSTAIPQRLRVAVGCVSVLFGVGYAIAAA
ncbi:MAG: hypothetical protein PGN23_08035 [Sphingomonas adhaesiva]|uniref:hypothetical protein n=1 Tax=Sphingomonas adhaesiva TaxID=28212 RepID=UPI002FF8281D